MKYYIDLIKRYGIFKCICRVFGNVFYTLIFPIYKFFLLRFSKIEENKVLFMSTPFYSDNSKALYDYLRVRDKSLKFVWLMDMNDEPPKAVHENTGFFKYRVFYHRGKTFSALKEIATSKYLFFTHASPVQQLGHRQGQMIINLWHGCGYKDLQKSKEKWITQNPCDFSLVPGKVFIETKHRFWGCEREKILPIGYPRYDLFKADDENAKQYVDKLANGADKLVIWMPTFRKTRKGQYPESKIEGHFELPIVESVEQLSQLNEYCNKSGVTICVKRHPAQISYECEKEKFSNIRFISSEDLAEKNIDLYAMLKYTDALISDYSSAAIDYLLLNRPVAFSLDDFEAYKNARGFVFEDPLKYMPGHHLYTFKDMMSFIDDISHYVDRYAADRKNIMPEVHNPCDNYCERIWETVKELMENTNTLKDKGESNE